MSKETNEFIIFTPWLAYELRKQGFKLLRTDVNKRYPQYDCWVFEDSVDLQLAISFLTKRKKQR